MTQFLSRLLRYGSIQVVKNTGSVRKLHTASLLKGYEGEGKTTATVLNIDYSYGLMIDGCSVLGFQLNNGINVIGPMIIFPKTVLNWNIASSEHMNEDSFALFSVLYPQVDIMRQLWYHRKMFYRIR
ncbi:NADH dehydrogenase [ubiquinone] 1 alpha subcomplex assembly factor 3 isoform X2 [Orussus abietinus]|uniref:NADH dehydrogenase [ubiquinone] 1 alpha subcomplex assembly factor 3 isoform X2 n=1 Tax=Orussus abietinus TaxID=222816 RepID=UPI0006267CD0|nr:NADH dehydrogenase [ubiquinone] 1 alpha subcomplex assembly factor 3 isoform X2 [Orussus abietinus]